MRNCQAHLLPHLTPGTSRTRTPTTTVICGLASISLALTLSGCGGAAADAPTAKATPSTTATVSPLTIEDAWVKTADSGMTAVFGQLRNTGGSSMNIVSATTSASPRAELHEVAMVGGSMKMQPKKGGFVIGAGSTYALAPGGNHIMVMGLKTPIRPGDTVDVTLSLADGSTVAFSALGKASSGGSETYAPEKSATPGMSGMEKPTSTPSSSAAQ